MDPGSWVENLDQPPKGTECAFNGAVRFNTIHNLVFLIIFQRLRLTEKYHTQEIRYLDDELD
jgi:hypothetical protein